MDNGHSHDSGAWRLQTTLAFVIALAATSLGIFLLDVDLWARAFLGMGLYFTCSSAFSLAKTLRDQHESRRLISKIDEAKTEKILREYGAS